MNYRVLKIEQNSQFENHDDLIEKFKNSKFSKVLNNLLSIKSRGDYAVFTSISESNIDLFNLLKENDINKFYNQASFKIKIPRPKITNIEDILSNIKTKDELLYSKDEINVSTYYINQFKFKDNVDLNEQKNWELFKKYVIEKNKERISRFNSQWSRYIKKVNDAYDQDNIWPLYIGTFFIKVNINSKAIYAPLILKEVEIIQENNDVYIQNKNDSLIINEKLLFFLQEFRDINIPKIKELEEISFEEVVNELTHFFKEIILFEDFNILKKFKKLKTIEIKDSQLVREPGILLMMCNPIGSSLRNAFLELINSGKINDGIIKWNNDDFGYSDAVYIDEIIEQRKSLPRICPTDFSQEKAIFSSLKDSTIIIGPPGTGKSQTIANILANILYENKSALFISQKKVALQVVLERLKELKYFTLQLVESTSKIKVSEKQDFYNNLKRFLKYIDNNDDFYLPRKNENYFIPLISEELKEYWKSKENIKNKNDELLDLFCQIKSEIPKMDENLISTFKNKKLYETINENSIDGFKALSQILGNEFDKKFIELVFNVKENINDLTQEEINSFLNLKFSYDSIEEKKLEYFLKNKNKFNTMNWELIEKFSIICSTLKNKNNYYEIFHKIDNLFDQLKAINKFECIDKMYILTHTNDKKIFANEFDIKKQKGIIFKKWDKNFKMFWSINNSFKNIVSTYDLSRNFIRSISKDYECLKVMIENIEFLNYIANSGLNQQSYEILKLNLKYLNVWLKYFDFLNIVNRYSLNKTVIEILKLNQNSFENWINNFDGWKVVEKYDIKYKTIDLINKIDDIEIFKEIHQIYVKYHSKYVPKINDFIDNSNNILDKLVDKISKIIYQFSSDEKKEFRYWRGKVDRHFAKPYSLISQHKTIFKKLFNVVVSTPETLATYVDFLNEEYDYIIFDEASQMFLEKAIPFLAIGKKIVIAGDDQQMQPSNWFGIRVSDEAEDEQEDENIDSLLTYAINAGMKKQTLELNYRSNFANLTSFSSKHFYDSQLKCLDKNEENNVVKSIDVIDVNGTWTEDKTNFEEAKKMIEILKENIDKYEKIILLTFNAPQMDLVDNLLSIDEPEIYKKLSIDRTIILKNLENIQGDEADLVIVSVAYTIDTKIAHTYICRQGGRNALNVAITRAKKKMIVLKSINSNEIIPTNDNIQLFKYWINFIESNQNDQKNYSIDSNSIQNSMSRTESQFEEDVLRWLKIQKFPKHIKVYSQYPIGSYRIDVALLDFNTNKFLLGLEIDGYRYHSTPKQKYNDELRQKFIESKGYIIYRIPELKWKSDKNEILYEINDFLSM